MIPRDDSRLGFASGAGLLGLISLVIGLAAVVVQSLWLVILAFALLILWTIYFLFRLFTRAGARMTGKNQNSTPARPASSLNAQITSQHAAPLRSQAPANSFRRAPQRTGHRQPGRQQPDQSWQPRGSSVPQQKRQPQKKNSGSSLLGAIPIIIAMVLFLVPKIGPGYSAVVWPILAGMVVIGLLVSVANKRRNERREIQNGDQNSNRPH